MSPSTKILWKIIFSQSAMNPFYSFIFKLTIMLEQNKWLFLITNLKKKTIWHTHITLLFKVSTIKINTIAIFLKKVMEFY